jgi:hypothetical protein
MRPVTLLCNLYHTGQSARLSHMPCHVFKEGVVAGLFCSAPYDLQHGEYSIYRSSALLKATGGRAECRRRAARMTYTACLLQVGRRYTGVYCPATSCLRPCRLGSRPFLHAAGFLCEAGPLQGQPNLLLGLHRLLIGSWQPGCRVHYDTCLQRRSCNFRRQHQTSLAKGLVARH